MILWLLLLLAFMFPPTDLYPEPYILPKWMAAIWVVLLLGVFSINPKGKYLPWAACLTGLCISVYSPFENESVRAMHLCLLFPFVWQLQKNDWTESAKLRIGISWLVMVVMIVCLLVSKCRTGYLYLLFFFFFRYLPHHRAYRITAFALVVASIFLSVFCMKTDSSRGRWFILQNTMELVAEKPLMGYGRNGFRHEYMQRQAAYFHKHPDSQYTMFKRKRKHTHTHTHTPAKAKLMYNRDHKILLATEENKMLPSVTTQHKLSKFFTSSFGR